MVLAELEHGLHSDVAIYGDELTKTTFYPYSSIEVAEFMANRLQEYYDELSNQPLRVTTLRSAGAVELDDGFHVRHTYELIDGPSLSRLTPDERHNAVAQVLMQIDIMDVIENPDKLRTPIDAKADNFHIDENGPALVDMYPPLNRLPDGQIPLYTVVNGSLRGRSRRIPYVTGTKSGAMTTLLSTAIDRGEGNLSKLHHIARTADDWCYDALPAVMDSNIRDKVHRQIGRHFLPYFVLTAQDHMWEKINGEHIM
jgi:hypothetical protein